ncbi:calcium/calmodulin-dependent 3',5'-cyclic nucleotide phosphodiesterase 1A-like [Salvelinus namaycush]|uniref:Calcium/calmodulin-dependent 3',5'-cyclic nucleotide phosphodiesterase 1A-like n=1 Tax=Salvelinus namaycush TaxID=8040 RepID=A0A8U0Q2R3_SALNM|nr:calcium/calmodulin-dependent 3',5'-cyclic nucleotide phosphodiesterase 1A-like [Salvelinus namaycush]
MGAGLDAVPGLGTSTKESSGHGAGLGAMPGLGTGSEEGIRLALPGEYDGTAARCQGFLLQLDLYLATVYPAPSGLPSPSTTAPVPMELGSAALREAEGGAFTCTIFGRRGQESEVRELPPAPLDIERAPASIFSCCLQDVDKWSFDVFVLHEASGEHTLQFLVYELLNRYDLINRFRIPVSSLVYFVEALEVVYSKHRNPYHNLIDASDVTETAHYLMLHTGVMHWLNDLEILATLSTQGPTNNFHIQTRELRALVIEMVMSRDLSCHFQQIKTTRSAFAAFSVDKAKVLSLMLHATDISHPAKDWPLHYRWTQALMEFFRQGDKEAEFGLPFSPLCDRNTTMIAQSQIGFIDFIVEPTFSALIDSTVKAISPLIEEAVKSGASGVRMSSMTGTDTGTVMESVQRYIGCGAPFDYSLPSIDLRQDCWPSFVDKGVDTPQKHPSRI